MSMVPFTSPAGLSVLTVWPAAALLLFFTVMNFAQFFVEAFHLFQKFGRTGFDVVELQGVFAHDASAAGVAHATPVDERARYQRIGGTVTVVLSKFCTFTTVSVISVTIAVYVVLRHLYPVADAYHVVLRYQYACDESEDGVLEYQHQDGREGSQARDEVERGFVYQDGDDDDNADAGENHLKDLDEALHRAVLQLFFRFSGYPRPYSVWH